MNFRRIPVKIQAMQIPNITSIDIHPFLEWVNSVKGNFNISVVDEFVCIEKGQDKTFIPSGLWIVKEDQKEIYHMTDDNFKKEFEVDG